jgi:hypothetical protein
MAISPSDVLNKNKNLKKRVDIDKINLDDVTIDDLKFNGKNYDNHINLMSLLDNVSACQVSDAYNGISRRSGSIQSIKPVNNQKVWGSIFTVETESDDWGTSALAIDEAAEGDILFFKVSDDDKATMIIDVWTYATQNANYSISKDAKVDTWVLNSRANPIQGIVNRQKTRVDTEYKEGYKAAAVESVKNQNWDDLDVCIEKLEEAGVKDPEGSIKTAVGNAFKAQYIRAYQEGDSITMDEIETLLIDSGLGFDSVNKKGQSTFDIWIDNMNDQVLSEEEEE